VESATQPSSPLINPANHKGGVCCKEKQEGLNDGSQEALPVHVANTGHASKAQSFLCGDYQGVCRTGLSAIRLVALSS